MASLNRTANLKNNAFTMTIIYNLSFNLYIQQSTLILLLEFVTKT